VENRKNKNEAAISEVNNRTISRVGHSDVDEQECIADPFVLGAVSLSWLDADRESRILVDSELVILWRNSAARLDLDKRRDLQDRNGVLTAVNTGNQPALDDAVRKGSNFCFQRIDGDGHFVIRSQRLQIDGDIFFGVRFFGTGGDYIEEYDNLDVAFGLTKSETRLLVDMMNGLDAIRLSQAYGVSVETIRSHVRSIYLKLSVNSREALLHKVRPFRI
jgi:DNA-binding CsgD family transcriptional regulator